MKKNKKIAILAALIIITLVIWIMPRGAGKRQSPPRQAPVSMQEQPVSRIKTRSDFTDWGRNPFIWEGKVTPVSDLDLSGIIWDKSAPYAIINGMIVRPGDEISGKIIKDIEPNSVVLTDGQNDYILELK
ncbi:MAG: hypothetical protein JSV30_03105 [Candidatus Omnitrophota bacterium]|nr:MAG: hypothetical protein JSV30_03105 [Candidatus Omnitrophota bacterium]